MTTPPQVFPQGVPNEPGNAIHTRDHAVIRSWAARHHAEPATGEQTSSGPASVHVEDGGVGIRFNFPGFSRFRPISWTEWLDHFDRHGLLFVYEREVADRAHELWDMRGRRDGHDVEDWMDAARELRQPGSGGPSGRYRIISSSTPSR